MSTIRYIVITGILLFLIAYSCNWLPGRLSRFEVNGIDVSHYQAHIAWDKVSQQDIDFVFVKATEGIELSDSLFSKNWDGLRDIGVHRGAYHFFRASAPTEEQALNFIRNVPLEEGDLPPVLDVEILDGVSKPEMLARMQKWLFMVEIAYGVKPIIYTNQKFYNANLSGYFPDYKLWIARYNSREPRLADGKRWSFWQYRDSGRIAGIQGKVDMNVYRGTLEELNMLCVQPKPVLSLR